MKKWLRRARGAFGMGLLWGAIGFSVGMIILAIVGTEAADVPFPLGFALIGFLAGLTFAAVLALVERKRRFDQMSLPRFSALGGFAGLLFAGLFTAIAGLGAGTLVVLTPLFTFLGAGSAAGTLALARSAARGSTESEHGMLRDAVRDSETERLGS